MNEGDNSMPMLGQRAERVQMLREIASNAKAMARSTADRLYGTDPRGVEAVSDRAPDNPEFGSFAQLDLCLDGLERELHEAMEEVRRLSGT